MAGVFKKLSANDIKITPFEAHKQYDTTDLASIGASTASLFWSGSNKSSFNDDNRKYYQLDKLYYRNYIRERAHRLELDDATYTTQERRLYQSASILSLSQKTFGSEVQPKSFEISGSKGTTQFHFKDDGFGNLYDVNGRPTKDFPNEDNRVFYLAPVNGFKRTDLSLDYETGNKYVNPPFKDGYSRTVYDDSYFQNVVTFKNIIFTSSFSEVHDSPIMGGHLDADPGSFYITVENQPHLNFNDDDFAISFYIPNHTSEFTQDVIAGTLDKSYILTKEGAQNSPPLGTQAGGAFSTRASGALDITTTPSNPAFPYRIYVTNPVVGTSKVFFERYDGETLSSVSTNFWRAGDSAGPYHFIFQKSGTALEIYRNGAKTGNATDKTTKPCQNKSDITIFSKQNADGTYFSDHDPRWKEYFRPTQLQIWNQSFSRTAGVPAISESFTGTYPVGNIFYDNGFAVITHPKYMNVFDGGELNMLKYKNTHLITENEYQCTMTEDEFELTTNNSIRKIPFSDSEDIANFATGSHFKPYVTSVGLYDDDGNLLVVGKLGQPIKASSETDTTFVIRFDT